LQDFNKQEIIATHTASAAFLRIDKKGAYCEKKSAAVKNRRFYPGDKGKKI